MSKRGDHSKHSKSSVPIRILIQLAAIGYMIKCFYMFILIFYRRFVRLTVDSAEEIRSEITTVISPWYFLMVTIAYAYLTLTICSIIAVRHQSGLLSLANVHSIPDPVHFRRMKNIYMFTSQSVTGHFGISAHVNLGP